MKCFIYHFASLSLKTVQFTLTSRKASFLALITFIALFHSRNFSISRQYNIQITALAFVPEMTPQIIRSTSRKDVFSLRKTGARNFHELGQTH